MPLKLLNLVTGQAILCFTNGTQHVAAHPVDFINNAGRSIAVYCPVVGGWMAEYVRLNRCCLRVNS